MADDDLPPGMKPVGDESDLPPGMKPLQQGLTPTGTNPAGFPTYHGTPASPPTFGSRLGESLGVPTSLDQLKSAFSMTPDAAKDLMLGGPGGPIAHQILNAGQQGVQNVQHGAPIANEIPKFLLQGPLAPVGGQGVENFAEDVGNKMKPGQLVPRPSAFVQGPALGDLGGTILNLLGLRAAKGPVPEGKIAYATGAEARDVLKATPDIQKEVSATGRPTDLNDLIDNKIGNAKNKLNVEAANALGPIANQQIMPNTISQKILALITPNMDMTQPGRILKKQIQSAALEFQKPWTLAQLDQERMDANARLHSFEKKESIDQYAATRGNNRTAAIDKAIANGVRADVYPLMDRVAGKPPGYFAGVKDRIGALMNVESDAKAHRDMLRTKSLKTEGAPLMERLKLRGMVGEEGSPRFYFSNLLGPSDPLATAGRQATRAFAGPGTNAARAAALVQALRRVAPDHPLVQSEPQQ